MCARVCLSVCQLCIRQQREPSSLVDTTRILTAAAAALCTAAHPHHAPPPKPDALATDTRRSAACFAGWTVLFVPWLLLFAVAGPSLLGQKLYEKLDAYGIDLNALGIGF